MARLIDLDVEGDVTSALMFFDQLKGYELRRSLNNAVNDTTRQTKTQAARLVSKEAGLKVGTVKKELVMRRSTPSTLTGRVIATGQPIRLIEFSARQIKKGVAARAWGKRKVYPKTFIAKMRSGLKQVFVRKSGARLPIKQLYGPGIPDTLTQEAISRELFTYIGQRLEINTARQIDRTLRRKAGFAKPRG